MACKINTCSCRNKPEQECCDKIMISRGSTPLLTFNVDVDLREATVYIEFSQRGVIAVEKTGEDLTVEENSISCKLTQEDTLGMRVGEVEIQISYIFESGDRDNSNILRGMITKVLKKEVIEFSSNTNTSDETPEDDVQP